jgi:Cytochrome c oxidase subunit VIIc
MPFNYEGSKAVFGVKVAIFLSIGFCIPGVAAYYQMYA